MEDHQIRVREVDVLRAYNKLMSEDGHLSDRPLTVAWYNRLEKMILKYAVGHFDDRAQCAAYCERWIERYHTDLYESMCIASRAEGHQKAIKENAYREKIKMSEKPAKDDVYFVTVNPKPDVVVDDLEKATSKYVKTKLVEAAEYVFEQRGSSTEDMGTGAHAHMLIKTSTNNADFVKRTRSSFAKIVGNPNAVHIVRCPRKFIPDKREYMQGRKTGDGKQAKTAMDSVWRQNKNLQPYYTVGDAIQSESPPDSADPASQEADADDTETERGSVSEHQEGCILLQADD